MNGFSGSYSHSAGDRFIFKGGVTWPNSALGLLITNSGSSSSNRDYYGVDKTWFVGASWARPIFDCGGIAMTNSEAVRGSPIRVDGHYVEIDSIEIIGFVIANGRAFYHCGVLPHQAYDVLIKNVYIHDWVVQTTSDGSFGGVYPYSSFVTMQGCTVQAPPSVAQQYVTDPHGSTSGCGADGVSSISNCTIIGTSQGIFNSGDVHDNVVRDGGNSFSNRSHENGITMYGWRTAYNNVIYNWKEGTAMHVVPGWGGRDGTCLLYNNIIFDVGPTPIQISESGNDGGNTTVCIFNNILEHRKGFTIRMSDRPNPSLNYIDIRNNLHITDANEPLGLKVLPNTLIQRNNCRMTQAAAIAAGILKTDLFRESAGNKELLNAGVNLSQYFTSDRDGKPRTGSWDIGAYEHPRSTATTPAPPANLSVAGDK
jgi:hypothetical protein